MYRNSAIKGFELTLEQAGKLLKRSLKPYFATPKAVDRLVYKDLFRYGAKHGLVTVEETERWFVYRDNRNSTAHDYGQNFAESTLKLLPSFVSDVKSLIRNLKDAAARTEG